MSTKKKKLKQKPYDTITLEAASYQTVLTKKFVARKPYKVHDPSMISVFIPGVIVKICVKLGAKVKKGDVLVVFDAMKMHNSLMAPMESTVKEILVKEGDRVTKDMVLIKLKPTE